MKSWVVAVKYRQTNERVFGDVVVFEPLIVDYIVVGWFLGPFFGHDVQLGGAAVNQEYAAHADRLVGAVFGEHDRPDCLSVIFFADALLDMNSKDFALFVLTQIKVAHETEAVVIGLLKPPTIAILVYVGITARTSDLLELIVLLCICGTAHELAAIA